MISISHPQTQHSRKLVEAIAAANLLKRFYTSFFHNPDKFPFLPNKFKALVAKGYSHRIPIESITNFGGIEILWRTTSFFLSNNLSKKLNYYNIWLFDLIISRRLKKDDSRIFTGFENSSYNSFKTAKKFGKICVLDAASVHYIHQMKYYKPNLSKRFIDKINIRKAKEIELADIIVTLSSFAASTYKEYCPQKKIFTIPLGVDTSKFQFKVKYRSDNYFRFLFVGNVTYAKGIDLLIEAFSNIHHPELKLIIAGAKGDASHLLNQDVRIEYVGKLNQSELNKLYQQCDVLILPSRLDGFGMVVTEAMATGTPVIVSTHTGAKDLVKHDINGWIYEDGNVEQLKHFMLHAIEKKNELNSFGKNAYESVKELTWDLYKKRVQELYSNILN